jgi:hypothetical protein
MILKVPLQFCPKDEFPLTVECHKAVRLLQPPIEFPLAQPKVADGFFRRENVFLAQ